jgi:hypothetical protein
MAPGPAQPRAEPAPLQCRAASTNRSTPWQAATRQGSGKKIGRRTAQQMAFVKITRAPPELPRFVKINRRICHFWHNRRGLS